MGLREDIEDARSMNLGLQKKACEIQNAIATLDTTLERAMMSEGCWELHSFKLSFHSLRLANEERQKIWPGSDSASVEFRALEVAGEAGELAEAVKKYRRDQLGIAGSTATLDDIMDELGDLVIAADLLATKLGLSLGACVRHKFNKTSEKMGLTVKLI